MRANQRPVALYNYQGTKHDEPPFDSLNCGTYAGAIEHQRCGERPCDPCRVARNDYVREWRLRTGRVKSIRVRLTAAQLALLQRSSA